MHDGYLFTLGICGSSGGAAVAVLDAMLAALPPVKRAAYLGEIIVSEELPGFADPLAAPIGADIADAELLLLVTPLVGGALPPRLRDLDWLDPAPPAQGDRFVALVILGDGPETALASLYASVERVGARLAGTIRLPAKPDLAQAMDAAAELARAAYAMARAQHPGSLG